MVLIGAFILLAIQSVQPTPAPTPPTTPTPSPLRLLKRTPPSQTNSGLTLSDAAKRIKLKTPGNKPLKLTNETVKELAAGVELTTISSPSVSSKRKSGTESPRLSDTDQKKQAWQDKYQAALLEIIRLTDLINKLESDVANLQRDFYSRDDPAYRDGVVKPALDRAMADLDQARKDLEVAKALPDQVKAEAQRDGALPGWFRGLPDPRSTPVRVPKPS